MRTIHLLKEWALVCRALEEGRQILLARKGGILDEGGRFVPAYREFFLYPTLFHQSEQLKTALKPFELLRFESLPTEPAAPDKVRLRLFCRMVDAFFVTDLARLRSVEDEHIWDARFLEKRFEWGEERGITLLTLRVYRLDEEMVLPMKRAYAGCKSWVEATGPRTLPSLSPVLSDEAFLTRLSSIRRKLL